MNYKLGILSCPSAGTALDPNTGSMQPGRSTSANSSSWPHVRAGSGTMRTSATGSRSATGTRSSTTRSARHAATARHPGDAARQASWGSLE